VGLAVFVPTLIASATVGMIVAAPRTYLGPLLTVGVFLVLAASGVDSGGSAADYGYVSVLYGGAWALGRAMHDRNRRLDEVAARAERLEREREDRAAAAVAEERARIARELHDIVSHSITVIALQSQAVRRRLGPEHPRESADLEVVETTARQAMAEMRRLLGVLRPADEASDLAPQPGLDNLPRLLAGVQPPVRTSVHGEPVPLPPGVDLAAYRILQEGLTNIRKHAPGAAATIDLAYGTRTLDILIGQDRPGEGRPAGVDGAGAGLVGMRERAELYGGTFEAGPDGDGCFRIHARLPFRERA
jgi:signal transduction histidine kinase